MDNESLTANDLIRNIIKLFSPFINKRITMMPYAKGMFCLNGIQFITCIPRKPSDHYFSSELYPYVRFLDHLNNRAFLFATSGVDLDYFIYRFDINTSRTFAELSQCQYIAFVYYKIAICFQPYYTINDYK